MKARIKNKLDNTEWTLENEFYRISISPISSRLNIDMKKEVLDAMELAHKAKHLLRKGDISMEEAKRMCEPYINLVNDGAKKYSKEYGNPYRKVSATGFLR